MWLGGRHLGVRLSLTPDLHRIESASRWEMMEGHNRRLTSIAGACKIVCHERSFEIQISWGRRARKARKGGEEAVTVFMIKMVGRPNNGNGKGFKQVYI